MLNYQLIFNFNPGGELDFGGMLVYKEGTIPKEIREAYEKKADKSVLVLLHKI